MTGLLRQSRRPPGLRNGHDIVVDSLGSAIVQGRYQPGDHLPRDEELEKQFGLSRTVMREAMKTLAAKGMILARARVGTTVRARNEWNLFDSQVLGWHLNAARDDAFFAQLFEMRQAFEPFGARLAVAHATPQDIALMHTHVDGMEGATSEMDFSLADLALHRAILTATGNAFFHTVASLIEAALLTALRLSSPVTDQDRQQDIARRHRMIVTAVEARNADAAEAAMRDVIAVGWARIRNSNW